MSGCYQVCQAGHCEMRFVFLCHSLPWLLPLLRFRIFFVCRLPSSPAPCVLFSCSRAQPSRPLLCGALAPGRLPPLPPPEVPCFRRAPGPRKLAVPLKKADSWP